MNIKFKIIYRILGDKPNSISNEEEEVSKTFFHEFPATTRIRIRRRNFFFFFLKNLSIKVKLNR